MVEAPEGFGDEDLVRITEIENVWIPMPDGTRLAARLWLPRNAEAEPVPAILEYLPYRKRDFMRARDEPMHRYYALSGYASIRVDVRGTGDSEGAISDEYTQTELEDGVAVIAWLAEQPWCDGSVGMTGISWGGFNSLQIAALQPPALKAIITLCASDDRYADDAHYKGGCLLNENMQWGSILMMNNALPPDPEIVGGEWRDSWRRRIDALEPFPALWMRHPARDEYWRHGSVCEDFSAIRCPVYAIGGWADGYSNAVSRLVANLQGPVKGLVGPWAHTFPHNGVPGPAIGYLQEAVRWWDHWLKGIDIGVMDEPAMRVWMQESAPPMPQYETRPGRWVAEDVWPSPRIQSRVLHLDWGHLADLPGDPDEAWFSSPQTLGVRAGEWCGFGSDGEAPRDQRSDDGGSLVFTSDGLEEAIEIFGAPRLSLDIKSDEPVAFLVARLCDVHPDGTSARISYGMLNLCHRDGHDQPQPLVPGQWYRIELTLDDLAQQVPAGHSLRLALSTSYWPMVWPAPAPVTLTTRIGTGTLILPVRPAAPGDDALRPFPEPAKAPGRRHKKLHHLDLSRRIEIDLTTNEMTHTLKSDGGELDGASLARLEDIGLDLGNTLMKRYRILEDDPLSAQTELALSTMLRREDWAIRIDCRTRLSCTAAAFQFSADLDAFENDVPFASRNWVIAIPRNCL
jgi:putative CocE/NonD family hydrolase